MSSGLTELNIEYDRFLAKDKTGDLSDDTRRGVFIEEAKSNTEKYNFCEGLKDLGKLLKSQTSTM